MACAPASVDAHVVVDCRHCLLGAVLSGCAEEAEPVADAAAVPAAEQAVPEEPVEDVKAIVFKLYELLRVADMEVGAWQHTSSGCPTCTPGRNTT